MTDKVQEMRTLGLPLIVNEPILYPPEIGHLETTESEEQNAYMVLVFLLLTFVPYFVSIIKPELIQSVCGATISYVILVIVFFGNVLYPTTIKQIRQKIKVYIHGEK